MEKKIEILNEYLLSTQAMIERIEDDALDISQLDIDLAKQHVRDLYDAILDIERNFKADLEQEIVVDDDDFDVDEFVLSLDEEMADTFEEMEMGIPEGIEEEIESENTEEINEDVAVKAVESAESELETVEDKDIQDEIEETDEVVESVNVIDEEIENVEKSEPKEDILPTEETKEVVVSVTEELKEEVKEPLSPPEEKKEEIKVKKKAVKIEEETQTLFDFIEEKPSIQDKFNHLKIDDIRKAIGINEKFRFINELFKGDMNDYNDVVDKLNSLNAITEAEKYLLTYKIRYEWDEDMDAYKEFMEIVERRYL